MKNNDNAEKNYTIIMKEIIWNSENKTENIKYHRIPTSKENFNNHYRDINSFRKREQTHGRCVCPKKDWLVCNMDCFKCKYQTAGDFSSLNEKIEDVDGNSTEKQNLIADENPIALEILCDAELLSNLMRALELINPVKSEICRLWASGMSERDIAQKLGRRQSTVNYKRNSGLDDLRNLLKDFI